MKLLNYTTSYFAVVLLLLMAIWAVIFYFAMLDEINDSLDDGLANYKMLVIKRAQENPSVLNTQKFGDGNYTVKEIDVHEARGFKDSYRDTLMYMVYEEDYEPVRLLETVFKQEGSYYKLKLITSMVEEDDLIRNLLFSLLFLYLGLVVSILLLNNLLLKEVWNPFYRVLGQLRRFNIEKEDKVEFQETKIEEFTLLNQNIERLLQKSKTSYQNQKQFTENAAHELQTPLAISRNQLELLIEKNNLKEEEITAIASVLSQLERLSRFNKSLLLLSKIENQQFPDEENININALMQQLVGNYEDLAVHHQVKVKIIENGTLKYRMNKNLAEILLGNLLKNAILHHKDSNPIKITISQTEVCFFNFGIDPLDQSKLFERFYKQGKGKQSTGLGLSIAKAIAEKYKLELSYHFTAGHLFKVKF